MTELNDCSKDMVLRDRVRELEAQVENLQKVAQKALDRLYAQNGHVSLEVWEKNYEAIAALEAALAVVGYVPKLWRCESCGKEFYGSARVTRTA